MEERNFAFSVAIKHCSICYSNIPITSYNVCYTHKSIIIVYTSMTPCKEEVLHYDFIYMITLYVTLVNFIV